jgi:outer membrane usher protein
MLPDSQHGYAPVVRGVAQTNARVVIRQGGNEIYQTTVPPGPFLIQDLYSTSYQGDLQVEVREADGRISTFTVPFSAVPDSMRPGASRYNVTAGRVRDVPDSRAVFTDITYQRGLSNALTGNIGARLAKDYQSFLLGAVTGTPIGAFGANITYSTTKAFDGTRISGGLASLTYSHTFQPTSTTFSLAGYRYSTRGYRDLVDALGERAAAERGGTWSSSTFQQRNQLVANISQSFGSYGQVYLSASASDYYNTQSRDTRMQFGYSNSYKSLSYNLSFARQRTVPFDNTRPDLMSQGTTFGREGRTENIVMLSLSMPFGTGPRSASISGGVTRSARGASYQTSVSGMADEAQTLSYGASVSREAEGGSNLSVNAQKNLAATTIGGSFSQGSGYSQVSANARGAAVVHSGGLTLGPYLGETFGLIEAKGASGAGVRNGTGARIDDSGYALIPSLTAYRYNSVALDSQGIGRNVELDGNQQRVAPYAGAAVKLRFATRTGYALLVKAALLDGSALPLGADVYDNTGAGIGMVGQGGQVYARVGEKQGWLTVKWGKSRQEQCTINYDLSESDMSLALHRVAARCLPIGVIATNRAEPAAPQLE